MDLVYIKGMRVEAIIGIHPHERENPQPVVLDIEMGWDTSRPAATDRIDYALDYEKVAAQVTSLVQERKFHLVETLAEEVARMLTRNFRVPWLRLRVNKPDALDSADGVGVLIERDRRR